MMHQPQLIKRILRIPRRTVRESIMLIQLVRLSLLNRFGKMQVTQPDGPVVSLTTFGKRSEQAHLAIESIARGSTRPSRLILWIDEEALFRNLPPTIRRQQKRGLEVKFCKNYGPHKKYYPYVESQESFDTPLVTADDDFFYPRYWLKRLVEANREYPDNVNCFWVHVIAMNENGISKYEDWTQCDNSRARFRHLAHSGIGTILPPPFLIALKRAGTAFETCCPKADDIWLHVQALRAGYKVRQIVPQLPYFSFRVIPGTQHAALCHDNVDGDGNDRQITATYNQTDIQLLQVDCGSVPC